MAVIYTIEFQKRGLPHAHILLFLHPEDKINSPDDIDRYISAELPDKETNPLAFELAVQLMLHGPCGEMNPMCPCMQDGRCSKHFPKEFNSCTTVTDEGFPTYRRRDDGRTASKNGNTIDNRFFIPYNLDLLVKFGAHINVEWCNRDRSLKYLFKYMNKGPDMALVMIEEAEARCGGNTENGLEDTVDEIASYLNCRYVSASEACWRIFAFEIQHKEPPVKRLAIHLQDEQEVIFKDHEPLDTVVERATTRKTTLIGWMEANKLYRDARDLTYTDFPTKWVWKKDDKRWKKGRGE